MMKPEFKQKKQKSGACVLTVKGDLTVQYSGEFKEVLTRCLRQGSNFEILLKDVSAIDVTAVQLLQGVRRDLKSIEKILFLEPPRDKAVMEILRKAGLEHIVQTKN